MRQALGIGYEHLEGELEGGIDAWLAAGGSIARTAVTRAIEASGPVIDVRQASEFRAGHVPGALPMELGTLAAAVTSLPAGVLFMCGHGERAMSGASLAERSNHDASVFVGSPDDWARASGSKLAVGP